MIVENMASVSFNSLIARAFEVHFGWRIIEEIGDENVVQVVTDSASVYVSAENY
jgi:hypothetical protein